MVVGPVSRPRLRAGRETRSERETDAGRAGDAVSRLGERLRLAAAPRDRCAGHSTGARVAEIRLLRAAPRVVERHAKNGALSFSDLRAARVANEDGLSSHDSPSVVEITVAISTSRALLICEELYAFIARVFLVTLHRQIRHYDSRVMDTAHDRRPRGRPDGAGAARGGRPRPAAGRPRGRARAAALRPVARQPARDRQRRRARGSARDRRPRPRPQGRDGHARGPRRRRARRTGSSARRSAAR